MPQAIVTKYVPATNTRPSRIKATAFGGSATISFPYEENGDWLAALALIRKMGWTESGWVEGGMPDGQSTVFVRSK